MKNGPDWMHFEGVGEEAPKFEVRSIPNDSGEDTKTILINGIVITDEALKEKRNTLSSSELDGFICKRFEREIERTLGQYAPKFLFGFDDKNIYMCDDKAVGNPENIVTIPVEDVEELKRIKEIFDNPDENSAQQLQELLLPFEKSYTNKEKAVI